MTYNQLSKVKKHKNHVRMSKGDRIIEIVCYVITALLIIICFYPFWFVFLTSITQLAPRQRPAFLFPSSPTLKIYKQIFMQGDVLRGMVVSAARVIVSTIGCILFSSMFAFLMTRQKLPGRKIIYRFAIITMYVSGGLIPWYIMMRAYGLYNNFFVYVVPGLINVFFVILIKTYIESIPAEMEEAARIDGAGFVDTFFRVILPLSAPILATCAIYQAVGAWNTYMDNYLLVQKPSLQTVQIVLYNFIVKAQNLVNQMKSQMISSGTGLTPDMLKNLITPDTVRAGTTIVSVIPIMLIYPFLQKYFARGIMMGAVKG